MDRIDYEKMADYDDIHNRMLDGEAISPLGQFILDNEPADGRLAREFRSGLLEAIRYIATAAAEAQREACAVEFSRKADEHTQFAAEAAYTGLRNYHKYAAHDWAHSAEFVRETKLITESEAK